MEEDHKILKDKTAFKSTIHVIDNFSKDKDVFGLDKMPPVLKYINKKRKNILRRLI